MRNAAVHFKGRKKFLEALETKLPEVSAQNALLAPKLEALWQRATQGRSERLLKTLEGAHVFHYCTREQVQQLVTALSSEQDVHLPLPRFSRVLERSFSIQEFDNNAQAKRPRYGLPPLPATANRLALEQNPAQKCQYILMKLLYERAFRPWLAAEATPRELERWLETALQRTTNKARSMNAQGGKDERELVLARAAKLPIAFKGKSIHQFFHDLSAATATEMRVQRGYQSDATQAQEQAEYIDELLRDVVALAFKDYLNASRLRWLLEIDPQQALPLTRCCPLDQVPVPPTQAQTHPWQQVLYFLLHLMPVGEVSQLLHQLAKWEILAKPELAKAAEEAPRVKALQYTLKLYLDMHDSQYTGNELMPKVEREVLAAFNGFYENPRVFAQVFENQGNERDSAQYLPQRGLREIRRFGHIPVLTALGGKSITAAQVKSCLDAETAPEGKALSAVAVAQQQREKLHHDWVTNKLRDTRAYCEALADVIRHRHLATHIRLTDRVTAHRIVMKVLARLADFSGLFERDLTFVVLSWLNQNNLSKDDLFKSAGKRAFEDGRVLEALGTSDNKKKDNIKADKRSNFDDLCTFLRESFHCQWDSVARDIRKDLAHFNMLHSDNGLLNTPLNLTYWVNQTRTLMAYDRKLKNAVSQSIMELLEREGFILKWEMDSNHQLTKATVTVKTANHLRGIALPLKSNGHWKRQIREALHSQELVDLLAGVFGGTSKSSDDITTLKLDDIDWEKVGKPKKNR